MKPDLNHAAAEEPEDENYFISLSDLMTGVVFIFVILLCAFAFNFRNAQEAAQTAQQNATAARGAAAAATARAEGAAKESERKSGQIDALSKALGGREKDLRGQLREMVDNLGTQGVKVELDAANGVVRLPEALLFQSGSADLGPAALNALALVARQLEPVLARIDASNSKLRLEAVFLEGHTDDRPIHTSEFRDNLDLSTARATRTFRAMVLARPELERHLNPSGALVLGVSGYGEQRPIVANDSPSHRAQNRRIDLRFLVAYPSAEDVAEIERLLHLPDPP